MSIRSRSRGGFIPATQPVGYRYRTNCSENTWFPETYWPIPLFGVLETMNDYVTPNFYARVRKGEVIFNDMNHSRTESNGGNGVGYHMRQDASFPCGSEAYNSEWKCDDNLFPALIAGNGNLSPSGVFTSSDMLDLCKDASTACLSSRGDPSSSNMFESVAEIRDTVNLLRHPLESLGLFLDRNGRKIRKLDPAKAWLAYRYGIMPLVNDISSVLEGLKKKVGKVRQTSRGFSSGQRTDVTLGTASCGVMTVHYQATSVDTVSCRAMSLDEYYSTLAENIGFSGKGLLSLPWELIPYSFVADWFANVGDFLRAIVPLPNVKQLGSCLVTHRVLQTSYSALSTDAPSGYTMVRPVSGNCFAKTETKTRTALTAPGLVFKSNFRLDDFSRMADSISLLDQRLGRLF